jgi:hemerythrin-like domain-containing protein
MGDARDPIDQLERCHRRMEEALARLEQAAGEPDGDQEVVDTLAWLDRTAARHVEDEEQSLFPRLRARAELVDLVTALSAEHVEHDRVHDALRVEVTTRGPHGPEVPRLASELARVYRDHIEREERELLPAARATLGADDCAAMSAEMEQRRESDGRGRGR